MTAFPRSVISGTRGKIGGRPLAARSEAYDSRTDPFSDASGAGLFETAHTLLTDLGVRVPELYLLDRTGAYLDCDLALVEHLRGGTLEERLGGDGSGAGDVMDRLAASLELMYRCRGDGFGKVGFGRRGRVLRAGCLSPGG